MGSRNSSLSSDTQGDQGIFWNFWESPETLGRPDGAAGGGAVTR